MAPGHQYTTTFFTSSSLMQLAMIVSGILLLSAIEPSEAALVKEQPLVLKYHNGPLLKGNITLNLIWYGAFTAPQRSIITDFIHSLSTNPQAGHHHRQSSASRPLSPSVAAWWHTTSKYEKPAAGSANLILGKQLLLSTYPLGKSLKTTHLLALSSKPPPTSPNSINVLLTSSDVSVDRFCMSRCATHGSTTIPTSRKVSNKPATVAYAWVGNPETQCPGQCAWPFHQPIYGPQSPPLISPNNDVGVDGMIINLATVLAGAVTNPFSNGYFQGPATAPLEAVTACTGAFGKGSYPGYPGEVLVDKVSGASYNAHGMNGRKYLLPAMWDPQTSACRTLV